MKSRNAFITGATGSIGFEISKSLMERGCNVFLTGRDAVVLDKNIQYLRKMGKGSVFGKSCDLSKIENIYSMISFAKEKFRDYSILINAAGIYKQKEILKLEDSEIMQSFNVNVFAPFVLTREMTKQMIKKKWGRIVNIGSSSSYYGFKKGSLYCATKHALLGFSKAVHEDLKQHNVRSYFISPSSTKGKMGRQTVGQDYETFLDPVDIARFVVFSISFESNIMTEEIFLKRMEVR
jgi:short-subunit dehydrogenase